MLFGIGNVSKIEYFIVGLYKREGLGKKYFNDACYVAADVFFVQDASKIHAYSYEWSCWSQDNDGGG